MFANTSVPQAALTIGAPAGLIHVSWIRNGLQALVIAGQHPRRYMPVEHYMYEANVSRIPLAGGHNWSIQPYAPFDRCLVRPPTKVAPYPLSGALNS